jgi:hypothetical protein
MIMMRRQRRLNVKAKPESELLDFSSGLLLSSFMKSTLQTGFGSLVSPKATD